MINDYLRSRVETGEFSYIDAHFADLMCRLAGSSATASIFLRLSRALRDQHTCLELDDREDDIGALQALGVVGSGTGDRPLILEGKRLYLQRYFSFEVRIAQRLIALNRSLPVKAAQFKNRLTSFFPSASGQQQLATLIALTRGLAIITGGPGTGKTSTVANILRLLLDTGDMDPGAIRLAAPTGKAAMRLAEALRNAGLDDKNEVVTLHRLLGQRAGGRSFRYGPGRVLPLKLLIVDEVSMIDLAMMDRLLAALPDDARLILIGDPDQLPSVDIGSVLADICKYPAGYSQALAESARAVIDLELNAEATHHHLTDAVCPLGASYRFSPERGIGKLSAAVRHGTVPEIADDGEVSIAPLGNMNAVTLASFYDDYLRLVTQEIDAPRLLEAFERQRVLTPVRDGEYGVVQLNEQLETILEARGLKPASYYHGRPLLVTRNDYRLGLFNGDVGICVEDPGEETRVVFGDGREFLASRLPAHETCFVMTVHKSQGSEFDRVALVLPEPATESQHGLQSREMLYTAITRAKRGVSLYFDGDALERCIRNPVTRHGGLAERFLQAS